MIAALILAAHAMLLWTMEFVPYPELFIYPYLTRLSWLPYAQIIDHHSPGLTFFPVNLASLGLTSAQALKIVMIAIVIVQGWLVYKISKSRLALLWFGIWQPFFGGNHLWYDVFLPLLTLPAYLAWTAGRWAVVGLLLGTAVVVKQSVLPLVVFVAGLVWWRERQLRPVLVYGLGVIAPLILTAGYFWQLGVWADFWYWLVTFNLQVYALAGKLPPALSDWKLLSLPLVLLLIATWKSKDKLILGWAILSVVGGLSRFALVHLQPAIPFLALLLVRLPRRVAFVALVVSLLWVGRYYFRVGNWGQVRFFDSQTLQLSEAIKSRTNPGDHIFLLGAQPHLYVLTQTIPAGKIFAFHMPWILSVVEDRILSGLMADPPRLVVWDTQSQVDGVPITQSAPQLVRYVQDNYQAVATVGANIVYARRD